MEAAEVGKGEWAAPAGDFRTVLTTCHSERRVVIYIHMAEAKTLLTLVIPTYNEERRLPATLATLAEWIPQSCFDVEVMIIDDGSTDMTRAVAESFRAKIDNLEFVEIPHLGYMNAILTGLRKSTRPWRATLEADCPVHPRVLETFVKSFSDFDIVMGSRVLRGEEAAVEGKPLFRRMLSALMTRLFSLLFKGGIRDPQIGFKLYSSRVLDRVLPLLSLRHDGLKTSEIVVKALALGFRIKELPVHYRHDEDSRCVPKGNYGIALAAGWALLELWAKSYVEYRRGELPTCPVRFGFMLRPFWRLMTFPASARLDATRLPASLPAAP
jgi:dolichyl-phosphate beta-glucosyltransferase